MSIPTAKDVTQLYLYGGKFTPPNLVDDALIHPNPDQILDQDLVHEQVDTIEYMKTGAGRFALGAMSDLVKKFFSYVDDISGVIAGHAYTKQEMASTFVETEQCTN